MITTWTPAGLAAAALLLAGCETTHHAVFVTTTSLGFNFDSAPPTASIAYDRTEGFVGPSYDSGAIPPVLATIETDGNVIAPKIRQLYGTGAAAIISAGGAKTPGPATLTGGRHTAFIGTSTTLGLKAVFSTDSVLSSFNLGYKRKEFSNLYLGTDATNGADVYPSVLASVDMTVSTATPQGVALKNRQFIASGPAAEALADGPAGHFIAAAATNAAAVAAGHADAVDQIAHMNNVVAYVKQNGTWDATRLATLVDATSLSSGQKTALKGAASEAALRDMVGDDQAMAAALDAKTKP